MKSFLGNRRNMTSSKIGHVSLFLFVMVMRPFLFVIVGEGFEYWRLYFVFSFFRFFTSQERVVVLTSLLVIVDGRLFTQVRFQRSSVDSSKCQKPATSDLFLSFSIYIMSYRDETFFVSNGKGKAVIEVGHRRLFFLISFCRLLPTS